MTTIYAAILILSASGSVYRELEVADQTIGGIMLQVAGGLLNDAKPVWGDVFNGTGAIQRPTNVTLAIDGTRRSGFWGWWDAFWRVIVYVFDRTPEGSVEYSYSLAVRGYPIRTATVLRDGLVEKPFSTGWVETVPVGRSTRRIPIHVTIRITAIEDAGDTLLVGTGWGVADTSDFRCGFVRRIAEQRAAAELNTGLRKALRRIEEEGTRLYLQGDPGELVKILRECVRIGRSRLRR